MSRVVTGTSRSQLHAVTQQLVATAMGRLKADLVLRNGTFVNVHSGELLEHVDVAVKGDRIALVGDAGHTIGPQTQIFEVNDQYLAPGFLDAHVHIESSMITATQFARTVLPFGTTTCFIDPHEIANVLGLRGVQLILEECRHLPLKIFVTLPSCIPAAPGFETAGAEFGPKEIAEAMQWDGVIALGEMMNFPGVLAGDSRVHGEIAATLRSGKIVEGHDTGLLGKELVAYAAAGITSSHESVRKIDAMERIRNGMYAFLREGSAWLDIAETIKAVTEARLDSRHVCLVTDDKEPSSILRDGHVNHCVRRALQQGVDPIRAIQMVTLNPAEHYEVARELGSIAPARYADIVVLENLTQVRVRSVFADGRLVAKDGRFVGELPNPSYPEWASQSVHLTMPSVADTFAIPAPQRGGDVRVRVIGALEGSVLTRHLQADLPVRDGYVLPRPDMAILKTAVIERHRGTGNVSVGFTQGFAFQSGAVATTVAHDSHNLLVLGTNDRDMALAANRLAESGGGIITVEDGRTLALVELPIAGLMSDKPTEEVSGKLDRLYEVWARLGCRWVSPFMTMSLLALSVLPELRITDRGLLDTVTFQFVSPIIDASRS